MARRHQPRGGCDDIPVVSFSDLAFLLIIFFILATTLVKTHGFSTDFPSGEKSDEPAEKTPSVVIQADRVTLNDKPVDLATLRKELHALKLAERQGEEKVVLLEAPADVPYQRYFETMAAISEAGGVICIVREEKENR